MKTFPFDFELTKPIPIFPQTSEKPVGDVLEIGPGRGDLLLDLAARHPEKRWLAIELNAGRFLRLIPRIEKRGLKNIQLMQGNARVILPQYFTEENCLEKILVLFPDPWPKDRHAFHRLLTIETLWYFWYLLKKNGYLYLATDDVRYKDEILKLLVQVPPLNNALAPQATTDLLPELPATYFQKKWSDQNKPLYFVKHRKQ